MPATRAIDPAAVSALAGVGRTFARFLRAYVEAVRSAGRKLARMSHRNAVARLRRRDPRAWRKHRRRCAACNPYGHPPPLPNGLGHAYHARQLARRRRHRR